MKSLTLIFLAGAATIGVAQDSLNCHELGLWPVGLSCAVALDSVRDLAFIDSTPIVFVLDVSNPVQPAELSDTIRSPALVQGLCYNDQRLYVAASEDGLKIWDVSNPAAPTLLGGFNTPDNANHVAVADTFAYVADGSDGLRIVNVSNPRSPFEVGYYDTPGYAYGVAVAGSYAYVADHLSGLRIIDVSDPRHPIEAGYYQTATSARGVAVAGGCALVANYSDGLLIIDVSNPQNPVLAGRYDTPGYALRVTVSDNLAYVADYYAGLRIIDVSNPQSPFEAGYYYPAGNAMDVAVANSRAYVADRSAGLRIIEYYRGGIEEALRAEVRTPNRAATIVRGMLYLPEASSVECGASSVLLDITGRKALDLKSGPNDISRLAPGVYFVRNQRSGVWGRGADSRSCQRWRSLASSPEDQALKIVIQR